MKKIILMSNSPRRRELLSKLGYEFEIRQSECADESYPSSLAPEEVPLYLAIKKAPAYVEIPDEVVITADTVVVIDDKILGKPVDDSEAKAMLRCISGRTHRVVTGVCIKDSERQSAFSVYTDVTFKQLTDEEIAFYVERYHPMDKAGSYGIQEWIGYIGVTSINGSYFNVMGFPVQRVYEELQKFL